MSNTLTFQPPIQDGYIVKNICGCRIVYGLVPINDFVRLTEGMSKKAVMAIDIADRIGATFVMGEPKDIDTLRQMDLPVSEMRHTDYLTAKKAGHESLAMWLRNGERGNPSNAMAKRLFGIPTNAGNAHPSDPDDLRRCMLMLDATDSHHLAWKMGDVSAEWARLVASWDELIDTLRDELALGRAAPRTYQIMKDCLRQSETV